MTCVDLAREALPIKPLCDAQLIAFYLPMQTATRLAGKGLEKVKALDPRTALCCYGLCAPLNESYLRKLGVQTSV